MDTNILYFGDNLEILRKYILDNSIDLIYLDPPFNSKKDYNILFRENGGVESEAQIKAFTDTWHWTQAAQDTYHEISTKCPLKVSKLIGALHDAIGNNDVMAYLVMMTIRLVELHRVLKPTGSLYLHCDPTASHYLKLVLDQIFGPANFRNEIVWKRTFAHSSANRPGSVHDILLFYSKGSKYIWNPQYQDYDPIYIETFLDQVDEDGNRYMRIDLTGAGISRGESGQPWRGIDVTAKGRHWAYAHETLERWDADGKIHWPKRPGGMPRLKRYREDLPGILLQDVWNDIRPIHNLSSERLGYETQKPLPLLERIIKASSNEGDIVLDPFCGCGTAVVAAQKLKRRWIGIDITHLAINLMRNRLRDSFPKIKFEVIGEPKDLGGAKALAQQDRYQFQWWALGLIGARPLGEKKKGADKGIDGVITFKHDAKGSYKRVVVQVKSGHVGVNAVRELNTVVGDEAIGVLITLEPPTEPMRVEAVASGYYHSLIYDKDYPKIQILTIEELFHDKRVEMPPQEQTSVTFTKAPKVSKEEGEQLTL